jgi:hypothetical protein
MALTKVTYSMIQGIAANVLDFGAVGDGSADDTNALNAAFSSGADFVVFGEGYTYKITDTVVCPNGVGADFQSSSILYAGTRNRAAFQFGQTSGAQEANLSNVNIAAQTADVTNDGFVGLKIYNAQRNNINVSRVSGFTHNVEFVSRGQGVTGVSFAATFLGTCKYALTTTCDGAAFNYINANTFFVEDWTNISPQAGDTHGWFARGIAGASTLEIQNGNRVHFHSIQPGNGNVGEVRNACKLVDIASINIIQIDRYESGRGHIAVISGPVGDGIIAAEVIAENIFQIGLLTSGGGAIIPSLSEIGSARFNLIEWVNDKSYSGAAIESSNLAATLKSYSSSSVTVTGGLHLTIGDGEPRLSCTFGGMEMGANTVRLNGADRSIGFFVDIQGGESFKIWADVESGQTCCVAVAAYNAQGQRIPYPGGGAVPDIKTIYSGTDRYNRWTTDMGGAYFSPNTETYMKFTTSTAVKRLRVFIAFGAGYVRSFGIVRFTQSQMPMTPSSGLPLNLWNHYCGGDPTSGEFGMYGRGDVAYLDTASGSGLDGYQCTTGGYLCPAWAPSTAVTLGMLRYNSSNVYQCTTAGTTAGSGGPTGTGSSISDGTAVWKYLSTKAAFTLI